MMLWRDAKVKVADQRWWARIGDLLDKGQVFVVQISPREQDSAVGHVDRWTAAEVRAAIDSAGVILQHADTRANVVEVTKETRPTLPSERRNPARRGGGAG